MSGPGPEDTRDRDLHQLARHSGLNLAGSVVAAALNLVLPVLVTRGLAQADAGVFFGVTALFTILINVGTVGADTGVLRFLPRAMVQRRDSDVARTLKVAALPPLLVSLLLATALAATAGPLGEAATGGDADAADVFTRSVLLLAAFLPVAVLYVTALAASRGLGGILPLVVIEKIGRTAGQALAVAVVVLVGGGLTWVLAAWAVPYLVTVVLVGLWIRRRTRRVRAAIRRADDDQAPVGPDPALVRDFWSFSSPRALSRVFSVALQRADIVLVGALRGPADAALYAAATRFPVLGLMFVQAIQQVMAPRISEFLTLEQTDRARLLYRTTTTWLILVSWPIYLASAVFAPLLLDVFGSGYDDAAPAVVVLCLVMLVATACGPVDTVLLMGGRSVLSLLNTGTALVVMVVLDLLLIPAYGVVGAAVAWAVAILVNNLAPLYQVHTGLGMHPFGAGALAAAGVSVLGFGLPALASLLLLGETVPGALVAGAVGLVLGALLTWRWSEPLELAALGAVLRRRRGGRAGG